MARAIRTDRRRTIRPTRALKVRRAKVYPGNAHARPERHAGNRDFCATGRRCCWAATNSDERSRATTMPIARTISVLVGLVAGRIAARPPADTFSRQLIAVRRRYPALRSSQFLHGKTEFAPTCVTSPGLTAMARRWPTKFLEAPRSPLALSAPRRHGRKCHGLMLLRFPAQSDR